MSHNNELPVYDLSTIINEGKIFKTTWNIQQSIHDDFKSRKQIVKVHVDDGEIEMSLGRLFINLFFVEPLRILRPIQSDEPIKITLSDLYMEEFITEENLETHFNKLIDKAKKADAEDILFTNSHYLEDMKQKIADIINNFSEMSGQFTIQYGATISLLGFIKMAVDDKEGKELLEKRLDVDGKQFKDIEDQFNSLGGQIMRYFKEHPETDLHPFVISNTGINKKQITQAISAIGLKPDLDGNVIPLPINTNYLQGLQNIDNYLVNAKGQQLRLF